MCKEAIMIHSCKNLNLLTTVLTFSLCLTGMSMANASPLPVTFGAPTKLNVPGIQFPTVADMDGDGHLDIVAPTTAGFSVFYGKGDGTFTEVDYQIPLPDTDAIIVADFNGDHQPDIAFTNGGDVGVILSTGYRTFAQPIYYHNVDSKLYGICSGDFNKDGKMDIAVADNASGNVTVLRGNGNGTFTISGVYPVGGYLKCIQAADLTGSGILDLIVSAHYNATATILYGDGTGDFPTTGSAPMGGGDFVAANLDNAGLIDLVGNNYWNDQMGVALSNGTGTFGDPITYSTDSYPSGIYSADFNGDGYNDLTIGQQGASYFTLWLNNGDGSMDEQTPITTNIANHEPAVGDFNEDGLPDVVVDDGPNFLSVYLNTTNPAPTTTSLLPAAVVPNSPSFTLKIHGTGFMKRSVALCGTHTFHTAFASNTLLYATVPAALLTKSGELPIAVSTNAPAGGMSNVTSLTVTGSTSVVLVTSTSAIDFGQPVTIVGSVAQASGEPVPTGTMTFLDNNTPILSGTIGIGGYSFRTNALPIGSDEITAVYSGDSNYAGMASAPQTVTVSLQPVAVSLIPLNSSGGYGSAVTFLTTVTPTASGSTDVNGGIIDLKDNGLTIASALIKNGIATMSYSNLPVGTTVLSAYYKGDATTDSGTSSTVSVVVPPPPF
jgi:hypothetical protein